MPTAVFSYAVWANVKQRMQQNGVSFGTNDDTEGPLLCNQVNGWIESQTGRPLGPYPLVATTVASGFGAGARTGALASGANIQIGDALLFGPVSGTHEHGIVVAVSGVNITLQYALTNGYANGVAVEKPYVFDVEEPEENGRMVPISNGMVYATNLEVAAYTGGPYNLIPQSDWFLRPTPLEREPGWPATELWMTDIPSSGNPFPYFPRGLQVVRLTGCQPGWPATPDEITGLAESLVVGVYRARSSGGGGTIQVGTDGSRTFERLMTNQDWKLLNTYASHDAVVLV